MHASVYLPLLIAGLFGLAAPRLRSRLPPVAASWLLSVGGLIAAAGAAASLTLLGIHRSSDRRNRSPRQGHWSITAAAPRGSRCWPRSPQLAIAAVLVLAVRFAAAGCPPTACACAPLTGWPSALPPTGQELAVLDDPAPHARAVPGASRPDRRLDRVVAGCCAGDERRAVLAHERSHLRHRHHLHQTAAVLAAAANPLLYRLPAAVALSTERWADEDAAAACDRRSVAEALTGIATGYRCRQAVRRHPRRWRPPTCEAESALCRHRSARLSMWRVARAARPAHRGGGRRSRGRARYRAPLRARPGRLPGHPPFLVGADKSETECTLSARFRPRIMDDGVRGDRRTGIETHPRSTRVGRRTGIPADARSGNRVNSSRRPISPSARASAAPTQ